MDKEQEYTPKYWVVHDKKDSDILVKTMSKSKDRAITRFFGNYNVETFSEMSDDELYDWWDNQTDFVCELIEIKLVNQTIRTNRSKQTN